MNEYPTFFELAVNLALSNGRYERPLVNMTRAERMLSDWNLSSDYIKHGVTAKLNKTCIVFTS